MKRCVVLAAAILGCGDDPMSVLVIEDGARVAVAPELPPLGLFGRPVPDPAAISSTFGPRWKASDDRYDFHLGIDYFGELASPVLAIGAGTVEATYAVGEGPFPNAGNVIVVQHALPPGQQFHGKPATRVYAVYLHLDSIEVAANQVVTRGQQIGRMGMTGDTEFVHLHFETRVETVCSLPFQLANPTLACVTGFDPHVHPFVFVGGRNEDAIRVEEIPSPLAFGIRYAATRGDLDLDRIDWTGGSLGFNHRHGIDASTTPALDNFNYGAAKLSPDEFLSTSAELAIEIHFVERPQFLELRDIFGTGVRFEAR
ncbi:MAG: M23 family metallopeptidase [Kofleriaceae bacterium]